MVEHHRLGESALEAEDDPAAVMRDAYPFLRGYRPRDSGTVIVQQLVCQLRLSISPLVPLQLELRQRCRQIPHRLAQNASPHAVASKHGDGGAHFGAFLTKRVRG
ncbi:hypothetical protein D3C85_1510030 [compost metagenome]